jgi:YidC/Oxa1 family membrane protein insertase
MAGLGELFGNILYRLYSFTGGDYGFALIIFTIIVKLILMPLNIKQIKSSMKMQELQPALKKLQDKYKDNKQKLNEEMMKFFKENDYNPANGCVMTLIQLPILIVLWQAITKPLTNMLSGAVYSQKIIDIMKVKDEVGVVTNITKEIGDKLISQGIDSQLVSKILDLQNGMHFLGIFNLAKVPSYSPALLFGQPAVYLPLLLIVILAALFTFISSKMMMSNTSTSLPQTKQEDSPFDPVKTQKTMLLLGPVMTFIFAFSFPAGLALYWLAGYVFQIFQQLYINKTIHSKKIDAGNLKVLDKKNDAAS